MGNGTRASTVPNTVRKQQFSAVEQLSSNIAALIRSQLTPPLLAVEVAFCWMAMIQILMGRIMECPQLCLSGKSSRVCG